VNSLFQRLRNRAGTIGNGVRNIANRVGQTVRRVAVRVGLARSTNS
jgi:hypothetical protein